MAIDHEEIAIRESVWVKANEMVGPLADEHGFEKVVFSSGFWTQTDVITPVEQHITAIMRVADWLLKEFD